MATVVGAVGDKASSSKEQNDEEDREDCPQKESSSIVLFHPPAAHEEHSEDSENEDCQVQLDGSARVANKVDEDGSLSQKAAK